MMVCLKRTDIIVIMRSAKLYSTGLSKANSYYVS